ncbi:hypothetical protein HGO38_30870 [Rhizobium sp. CG5]|uniref:hypothetical protein n=1 Tax=Rhizobium sp. CG5 TaxID=2726076 RepID=UPI00203453AA|nr:hypothetical protein [Rhizobium sp. CG5]MCM2477850.1 hypothetical protein [Rhizobium sp. CG5]
MRSLQARVILAGTVVVSVVGAVAFTYGYIERVNARDHLKNPARISFILNLQELPSSVRDTECSARAITDIIISCAFKIDPTDFELLLRGWDFKSQKINGNGRTYGEDAPVGPDFEAVTKYVIHPDSFKNGGLVDLVTNRDRSLVVANRFEE